ncbi:unnamed protein product, partial [Allacma fusca]
MVISYLGEASERESRQSSKPGMNSNLQKTMMYMMERLDEPLYVGPKGGQQNYMFEVDSKMMDDMEKA